MREPTPSHGPETTLPDVAHAATGPTYATYLRVHDLTQLQEPLSQPSCHDEMLFIIIHQVYELWFKQVLHEIDFASEQLDRDNLLAAFKCLGRVQVIFDVLNHQIDVLETMTPIEFNRFRDNLRPASGFQSYQFRVLEFRLGLKNPAHLRFHAEDAAANDALSQALAAPTIYDRLLHYLTRHGFDIPAEILERDVSQPNQTDPRVQDVLLQVYEQAQTHYALYLVLEALLDVDEKLLRWRYLHVCMVERMIGSLRGTGGSSGVGYLASTTGKRCFPDLWSIRNRMGAALESKAAGESIT